MTLAVEFSQISRHYDAVRAVDNVSLAIADGEFFSMLGPSGSGKTTCLRLIAGFEQPSAGSLRIHGQEAAGVPPYLRDVNTVFQDYALFPHMSVLDNVAYGLMVKGVPKSTRLARAEQMLAMVKLADYGMRKPAALSGGQRQRVALARALINQPRVLLLDEPLGALDLKLREAMQSELKALQKQLGITFIYVTHDQGEALSMSDRVAVFNKGRIEQVDSPQQLYTQPRTAFVADFVGGANVLPAALAESLTGRAQACAIRPEQIYFLSEHGAGLQLPGQVLDIQYHGAVSRFEVAVAGGQRLAVAVPNGQTLAQYRPEPGSAVRLAWAPEAMVWLSEQG